MKHTWLDKSEYPFTSRYFAVNGQQMHYIDEGQGDVILFVHGTPSWSFDFRNIIKELKKQYRCIAIDHIGFGLSDKPEHYDYSTINHSKLLEQFVVEKNLENFTLVVHDFGGPIGLNMAMQQAGRIKNMVILNSWLWSSANDEDFMKLSKILRSPLLPFLYRYLNFSPRFILPQSFGDKKLSAKTRLQYTQPFSNKAERNGALSFAKSLLNDQNWFEELWQRRELINAKPVLFIWGMKDPVIKAKYLEKFQQGFPNSTTCKLESCGHFPQEEEAERVTQALKKFLSLD
ncbi:MAG: alpha/beta fold hydrolase [Bacteroidetes bacterium]|nr:alpha/beta fold hydrolase [Bacteroidota bacterium]